MEYLPRPWKSQSLDEQVPPHFDPIPFPSTQFISLCHLSSVFFLPISNLLMPLSKAAPQHQRVFKSSRVRIMGHNECLPHVSNASESWLATHTGWSIRFHITATSFQALHHWPAAARPPCHACSRDQGAAKGTVPPSSLLRRPSRGSVFGHRSAGFSRSHPCQELHDFDSLGGVALCHTVGPHQRSAVGSVGSGTGRMTHSRDCGGNKR